MAKSEACEVFLEQEIKEGLANSKTEDEIGKELSLWLEKNMNIVMTPGAIRVRAFRCKNKDVHTVHTPFDIKAKNLKSLVRALRKGLRVLKKTGIGGDDCVAIKTAMETALSIAVNRKEKR